MKEICSKWAATCRTTDLDLHCVAVPARRDDLAYGNAMYASYINTQSYPVTFCLMPYGLWIGFMLLHFIRSTLNPLRVVQNQNSPKSHSGSNLRPKFFGSNINHWTLRWNVEGFFRQKNTSSVSRAEVWRQTFISWRGTELTEPTKHGPSLPSFRHVYLYTCLPLLSFVSMVTVQTVQQTQTEPNLKKEAGPAADRLSPWQHYFLCSVRRLKHDGNCSSRQNWAG